MENKYFYSSSLILVFLCFGIQVTNAATMQIGNPAPGYIEFSDQTPTTITDFSLSYDGGVRDPNNSDISNLIEEEGRISVLSLNDFWLGDDGRFYSNLWVYDFETYSISDIQDYDSYIFRVLPVRHIPVIPEIPDNPAVIPIPAPAILFASGIFGLIGIGRFKDWFSMQLMRYKTLTS
jgi:hypothetical protein